jgi:hypothetical protein
VAVRTDRDEVVKRRLNRVRKFTERDDMGLIQILLKSGEDLPDLFRLAQVGHRRRRWSRDT